MVEQSESSYCFGGDKVLVENFDIQFWTESVPAAVRCVAEREVTGSIRSRTVAAFSGEAKKKRKHPAAVISVDVEYSQGSTF